MSIQERSNQYGTVFGDWHIDRFLGKGGVEGKTAVFRITREKWGITECSAMKTINLIEQKGDLHTLSPKFQKEYRKAREESIAAAMNEVQLMYSLMGDKNIITYLDFTVSDWQEDSSFGTDLLIRMELMEKSLDQIEKELTDYDEELAYAVGKSICSALEYCHKANIIHRDIKPANIFLNKSGVYCLGDFGIARIISSQQGASTSTGTAAYAAPEQFTSGGVYEANYDERVDLYSLGLTLYELCNKHHLPFSTTPYPRYNEIGRRVKGDALPPPSMASPELAQVILKACEHSPEKRYQTAADLRAALERAEETYLMSRKPVISPAGELSGSKGTESTPLFPKKNPVIIGVPVAAALILCGAIALFRILQGETAPEMMPVNSTGSFVDSSAGILTQVPQNAIEADDTNGLPQTNSEGGETNTGAISLLQLAAERGDPEAQCNLGDAYHNGSDGVEQNYTQAIFWYRKAAEQDFAKAQTALGMCYLEGMGVKQDDGQAVYWFQKAAEQGDDEAQYNLGTCLYSGSGVGQDYKQAVEWFQKAAEKGHILAQTLLGNCYLSAQGVEQDLEQAAFWTQKAADQGNAAAQVTMGQLYEYGSGVKQDYKQAVEWYRKAAEQDYAIAQYNLGVCYTNGTGVTRDYEQAVEWYRKAVEQGYASAQDNLGICYREGLGVKQDYKQAAYWFQKAAEQGNAVAQVNLGDCYEYGYDGIEQDDEKAFYWYQQSANQGNDIAQFNLGECFLYGEGTAKNREMAIFWLRQAEVQGNKNAQQLLDSLSE